MRRWRADPPKAAAIDGRTGRNSIRRKSNPKLAQESCFFAVELCNSRPMTAPTKTSLIIFSVFLFSLFYAYEQGLLSPRALGVGLLIVISCFFVVLWKQYRNLVKGRLLQARNSLPKWQRSDGDCG